MGFRGLVFFMGVLGFRVKVSGFSMLSGETVESKSRHGMTLQASCNKGFGVRVLVLEGFRLGSSFVFCCCLPRGRRLG